MANDKQEPCTQHKQFGRTFCSDCVNELVKDAQHTAAEQLVKLTEVNRQLSEGLSLVNGIKELQKQQLADKERELATETRRKETAIGMMNDSETKLTAANAVIEKGEAFRNCPNSTDVIKKLTEFFAALAEHKLREAGVKGE